MIINGNSLEELKQFPDNYFHSVVTDPPYGLSFMGKKWDYDVPSVEIWAEVFRVLKEGGYLLSFAGTRTQHRMAVNIEDAGFEIRDMIAWVYGSGFPKSHNIGKAVDKLHGNEREELGLVDGKTSDNKDNNTFNASPRFYNLTKGTSEWEGWGTALKPALEPITMARKPFKGTVANNVLTNGVGGINIDGCRVGMSNKDFSEYKDKRASFENSKGNADKTLYKLGFRESLNKTETKGRFPANFIHDGSDEVKDLFPIVGSKSVPIRKTGNSGGTGNCYTTSNDNVGNIVGFADRGSASRFFYCAKASKKDRNEGLEDFEDKTIAINTAPYYICEKCNKQKHSGNPCKCNNPRWKVKEVNTKSKNYHPTVKPTDLMRYLVRLVTPKNGIVLDCFMGSGSTGKACALEGFEFVGIDLDKDYCEIAKARIDKAIEDKKQAEAQQELF